MTFEPGARVIYLYQERGNWSRSIPVPAEVIRGPKKVRKGQVPGVLIRPLTVGLGPDRWVSGESLRKPTQEEVSQWPIS